MSVTGYLRFKWMDTTFVAIHPCVLRQPVTLCQIHMGFNEMPKLKPGGTKERDSKSAKVAITPTLVEQGRINRILRCITILSLLFWSPRFLKLGFITVVP